VLVYLGNDIRGGKRLETHGSTGGCGTFEQGSSQSRLSASAFC